MSLLSDLLSAINDYTQRSGVVEPMQIEAVKEIRARLKRLDSQYDDLLIRARP